MILFVITRPPCSTSTESARAATSSTGTPHRRGSSSSPGTPGIDRAVRGTRSRRRVGIGRVAPPGWISAGQRSLGRLPLWKVAVRDDLKDPVEVDRHLVAPLHSLGFGPSLRKDHY